MAKALMFTGLVVSGLVGLYFHVEYSGWPLFFGLLGAILSDF